MFCVLGLALHYTDSRADRKIKELEKSRRESDSLTFELGAAVYKIRCTEKLFPDVILL
jgi:hypothetical protein